MGDMDNFNYLAVLISIILGLGITHLLSGLGRWVESRFSFPAYAPTILWVITLLVIHVQTWWTMYGMRHHLDWTFLQFVVVLLQPITLFLLAAVVLPGPTSAVHDLKSNYFSQRHWFFGLFITLLAVSVCKDIVMTGSLPTTTNLLFHALFLVIATGGMITARESYHRFIAYISALLIAVYIAFLFPELR
jgi:hypothetical protein